MSRRTISLAALTTLLALLGAAAPAYAIDLAPPAPHSPNAQTIHSSYVVMLIVTVLIALAINVALIAAVVRFRERRGVEPARFTAGRGALRPVLAGLAALAIAIFVFGVIKTDDARNVAAAGPDGLGGDQSAQVGIQDVPPSVVFTGQQSESGQGATASRPPDTSPLQIDAIAQQWLWRFEYPGHTPSTPLFSYGELVVPVDTPVILNITSTDVLHSWWVPALGGQVQAEPGSVVQTWFKADQVGTYTGNSTVYSGTSFPAMRAWVRVVTVPEYQAYLDQLGSDLRAAQGIVEGVQKQQDSQ